MSIVKDFSKEFFNKKVLISKMVGTFSIERIQDALISLSQSKLDEGRDAFGAKLKTDKSENGVYSPFNIKNRKQSFVDLESTGDFRNSFDVVVSSTFAVLEADFNKPESNIFDNFQASYADSGSFEEAILNLTDSDMKVFLEMFFLPAFLNILKIEIGKIIKKHG